ACAGAAVGTGLADAGDIEEERLGSPGCTTREGNFPRDFARPRARSGFQRSPDGPEVLRPGHGFSEPAQSSAAAGRLGRDRRWKSAGLLYFTYLHASS